MSLFFHELSHLLLSSLVAFIIWKKWYKHISVFIASVLGGVLVDLDHLIDYFLAFGAKLNPTYFLKGYQFLKTDKIYVLFHSWELVIIFLFLFILLLVTRNLSSVFNRLQLFLTISFIFLSFSLSLFLHLIIDVPTNNMRVQSYFLTYRIYNNFQLKTMVTTNHYQKHLQLKKQIVF